MTILRSAMVPVGGVDAASVMAIELVGPLDGHVIPAVRSPAIEEGRNRRPMRPPATPGHGWRERGLPPLPACSARQSLGVIPKAPLKARLK